MHIFIELWTMNAAWARLDRKQREALVASLGASTGAIVAAESIEALGWGFSDTTVDHPEGHQCFAVWRAPTNIALQRLAQAIIDGGWYRYADQINVRGELQPPEAVIGRLLTQYATAEA